MGGSLEEQEEKGSFETQDRSDLTVGEVKEENLSLDKEIEQVYKELGMLLAIHEKTVEFFIMRAPVREVSYEKGQSMPVR